MPQTLVFFHAHPDDEALLTAGTMARASAAGHRVVLVVATAGEAGLAAAALRDGLGERRRAELRASAAALGVARVVELGYADSGLDGTATPPPGGPVPFSRADPADAAGGLASLLQQESADVLTVYDAAGGYGHPDHVAVHRVGTAAAAIAGTPRLFEATVPREALTRAISLVGKVYRFPPEFDPTTFERAFTPRAQITHRVDVRRFAAAKRAAMAAHASQASADGADRTLAAFLRLPMPLYRYVFGTEFYREVPAR
ncbi:MAG: PIG-L family deacetylase [Actinomycetota bacterium]|nr:MAG: PIG-L family deacetylase [Actinomycetota bacterium]